jgi:hypothetical protein
MAKTNTSAQLYRSPKMEPQAIGHHANSNVSNILPLTSLRTIDLAGRKISDRLFSRFCAELRVFLRYFLHRNMCNSEHGSSMGPGSVKNKAAKL